MGDGASQATGLYLTDEYIKKNPTLHEEDSPWKSGQGIQIVAAPLLAAVL